MEAVRILPGVLCHLPPQAVEKLSCPQSAQLAACSELLSSKASPPFTTSPIPFSTSCLWSPQAFLCVQEDGLPLPGKERKSSRPVSPKATGSRADLISKGSLWVSTSGLGVPSSRLLLEGVRGILFLFGISLAARKEENGGDKTCKVLSRPGLHRSPPVGKAWHLGLNQGPGSKEGKARRPDVASGRPRLDCGRSF